MDFNDISKEYCDENEHLKIMSLPILQHQFQLDKEQRNLPSQFKVLSFMTQTQFHLQKLYKDPEQFKYNRNPHIMTFEPTRVTLGNEQEKNIPDNYINANIINIQDKKVIATQGPLTSTLYNFWRLCEKYKVTSIFMLCGLIEKTKKKCDRYYPIQYPQLNQIRQKQYKITLLQQTNLYEGQKLRKLLLTNTNNGYKKIIFHYQELNWPDGGVPLPQHHKQINQLLNILIGQLKNNEQSVIHCSAGVGRTGTFIAMALFKITLSNDKLISIFDSVRRLREQRWGLVYTSTQYEFLYNFVEREIKNKRILMRNPLN